MKLYVVDSVEGTKRKFCEKDAVVYSYEKTGKNILKRYKRLTGKYKVFTLYNNKGVMGHRVYQDGIYYDIPLRFGFNFDGDEDIILIKTGDKWVSSNEANVIEVTDENVKEVRRKLCL